MGGFLIHGSLAALPERSYFYPMNEELLNKAYDPDVFEDWAETLVELLRSHLHRTFNGTPKQVIRWDPPANQLHFWKTWLKEGDSRDFFGAVLERSIHTHHPKYMGHQVSAPAPLTALSGLVSSLLNNGMAVYEMGMAPSAIEQVVTDLLCKHIGYPSTSGGLLTSGGTLANLTALLSARKAMLGENVWENGIQRPLGVMVSEEAHYCIDRAVRIMGMGARGLVKVPAGEDFGMDISLLEATYDRAKKQGIEVFAIVASAPCTATGAYDNLPAITAFAQAKNLWLHVDGAHGGAAIFSPKYRYLLEGIASADSVVIDGHKMMFMPTITTALLFKNKQYAQHTFQQKADYLLSDSEEDEWFNSGKKTFECTKTMMSLHWYLLFKVYGIELFDTFVTRQYDLGQEFYTMLQDHPSFEVAVRPMSNIICFRFTPPGTNPEEFSELNARIRAKVLEDGEFYIVQTRLKGELYLRTSLMNPFTTRVHLEQLIQKIVQIAIEIPKP